MIAVDREPPRCRELSYVLPLRRWHRGPLSELTAYLRWLSSEVEVIVVDGSSSELFAFHHATWCDLVTHIPLEPRDRTRNGKVGGVMTGVRAATHERIVIADDDVRYDLEALRRISNLLDRADLVRPQNYFGPLTWPARWDTARTCINRAIGHDYPGTLGVRRSALLQLGGYDGESLFENLELIRTMEAAGCPVVASRSLYVRRLPPSPAHFRGQRVRFAYESFAQPVRMAAELSLLPAAFGLLRRRRFGRLAIALALVTSLAEVGRRRADGHRVFPASSSLLAPGWVAERAVCSWLALAFRVLRGGMPYAETTLVKAANSNRRLRDVFGAYRPDI